MSLVTSFSRLSKLVVFQWRLRDSKSSQVSRTLLSILTELGNAVVWMVSIHPLISNSSKCLLRPLGIVPRAPTTTDYIIIIIIIIVVVVVVVVVLKFMKLFTYFQ